MNSHQLFRRSRTRLALWYSLVMGSILGFLSLGIYQLLIQSSWAALEREIESIAGTLHDSLEPMLPASGDPIAVLQRILPELCLVGKPCQPKSGLIQRHTIGISDQSTYYIRLLDHHGQLLAFSSNQPSSLSPTLNDTDWQTIQTPQGDRYHQFTTLLHSANPHHRSHTHRHHRDQSSWGYLQIGRNLTAYDAEIVRIKQIILICLPAALSLAAISGWFLSGLTMKPIYKAYQSQQQFTADMAHELRSPLTNLLATSAAISRLSTSDQSMIPKLLQTIERQGRRLNHLVNDLLLLSSLEQNWLTTKLETCQLNDLIQDLAEEFLELAIEQGLQLSSQVPETEIWVSGNPDQLARAVTNLMMNAIHYTPAGGSIHLKLEQRDRLAMISIQDSGFGINSANLPRIFERFYRVDSDRSRQTGGTGLGLAIARAIVQAHQGTIQVTSEAGQGSLFTIKLPLTHT
ncbi:MAG: two-component sensor histidine kinase [Oscillatoriales cyanobacterium]|nr:MAG: two-component sensor histidine kinase [Oscillatoriales cyanobacterium]